jgi:GAF domain/PilZ domain/Sel1 repeat
MALAIQTTAAERRRQIRHCARRPAYASVGRAPKGVLLDLYQVLDISESGAAIRTPFGMVPGRTVDLCLDLRDAPSPVYASARVIWSDETGRVGLSFPVVASDSMRSLREWLRINKDGELVAVEDKTGGRPAMASPPRPDQSDLLAAVPVIQREAEACGADLKAALNLIALRTQVLLRATGAAIALAGDEQQIFECQGSAGPVAPPVGARLQVGTGFSGACVGSGKILRCDDAESDGRVDRESCLALGIRSMLAAPVKSGDLVVGLIEAFSAQPHFFQENDTTALQRLSETVLVCVRRAQAKEPIAAAAVPVRVIPTTGSVLFASPRESGEEHGTPNGEQGIRLPKFYLNLLVVVAATIFLVLGYYSAPWIQQLRAHQRGRARGASAAAAPAATPRVRQPLPEGIDQLKALADQGDASAENALGLRYFSGEGVALDEQMAAHWFLQAAEHGSLTAQSTLGSMYWAGRGVPYNVNQAYFWTVLARAGGDETGRSLAPIIGKKLTHAQAAAIELQAGQWIQQHEAVNKPAAASQ